MIGADDITFDLNGHRIDGDGTEFAGCGPRRACDFGVVNDGHDGVTVRDGSVREFGEGVGVGSARQVRVLGHLLVKERVLRLLVFGSARSLVRSSSVHHNIAPEGDGMGLFGSRHVRILDNKIRRNPGPGIHVEASSNNLIRGNGFWRNGPGILMEADRNEVGRNRFFPRRRNHRPRGSRNEVAQ